jgi:hypothetical protein
LQGPGGGSRQQNASIQWWLQWPTSPATVKCKSTQMFKFDSIVRFDYEPGVVIDGKWQWDRLFLLLLFCVFYPFSPFICDRLLSWICCRE